MTCEQCKKHFETGGGYRVQEHGSDYWDVCSLSCLTELAWKLREAEPKLSKSKTPLITNYK